MEICAGATENIKIIITDKEEEERDVTRTLRGREGGVAAAAAVGIIVFGHGWKMSRMVWWGIII